MTLIILKRLAITLLFTVASGFNVAHAALVTANGYTLDTETNIVTGGGLEWLQWDVTDRLSIEEALGADGFFGGVGYGTGWTLATNVQMAALFNAFGFNSTTDESELVSTTQPYTANSDDSEMDVFIGLFGATQSIGGAIGIGNGFNAFVSTAAIYGSDRNANGLFNYGVVQSDYTQDGVAFGDAAFIFPELILSFDTDTGYGIALVRSVSVSEPSAVAILALGLLGLGLRRKLCV